MLTTLGRTVARPKTGAEPRKKILYLHVAKAGGSSFNRFLRNNFNGESHCEQYIETRRAANGTVRRQLGNLNALRRLDFISGHLPYPLLLNSNLDLEDYVLVTIVRHPFAQTLSHLNWVIKISEDEESTLFNNVKPSVQRLSRTLRAVEDWSPDNLIHCLEKYPAWFQNNQSRYFLPPDGFSGEAIREVFERFALVGITERLDAFMCRFREMTRITKKGSDAKIVPHENRNDSYRVPLSLTEDPKVHAFLKEYNRFDMQLYAHAKRHLAP